MSRLILLAAVLLVAGCDGFGVRKSGKAAPQLSEKLSLGCYTVDLFDPYRLEYPAAEVPADVARFLGVWKDAAWNGEWCHDLYITEVFPDGTVTLLDAYGPYGRQGLEATVFKRKAKVEDGILTFQSIGRAPVSYEFAEDGSGKYLVGTRLDALGRYSITMQKVDGIAQVPIPPKKPTRRG